MDQAEGDVAKMWTIVGASLSGKRISYSREVHHRDLVTYSFIRSVKEPWKIGPR